jgi:hypothetical protein
MGSIRLLVGPTRRLTIAVIASASLFVSACAGGADTEVAPLPGLDSRFDVLLRACESGGIEQCEALYWDVAPDSEYATRALAMIPADMLAAMLERRPGSESPAPAPEPQPSPPTAPERVGDLEPDGEPYFETLVLTSGFADDPRLITVRAGGFADSSSLPVECQGVAIGFRPDVRLIYEAGPNYPLNIYAYSRTDDLVVVVRLPDGRFICNDDYSGLNPAVLIDRPRSGTYNIWVGVYSDDFGDGTLAISELTPDFG